jgi:hypothetical protein
MNMLIEKTLKSNLPPYHESYLIGTEGEAEKIVYQTNELGFRNKPFTDVVWEESVIVIGCSNVFGESLNLEETFCVQLEKILKIPVVNLGVKGSGIDFACWNSLRIHNFYSTPKAMLQIWSGLDRYTDFDEDDKCVSYVPKSKNYYNQINWNKRSEHYIEADRALWKNKTVYHEASFMYYTAKKVNVDYLTVFDYAKDLIHPGAKSVKAAAEKIAADLLNRGI